MRRRHCPAYRLSSTAPECGWPASLEAEPNGRLQQAIAESKEIRASSMMQLEDWLCESATAVHKLIGQVHEIQR
jgi:hypothetical protein